MEIGPFLIQHRWVLQFCTPNLNQLRGQGLKHMELGGPDWTIKPQHPPSSRPVSGKQHICDTIIAGILKTHAPHPQGP